MHTVFYLLEELQKSAAKQVADKLTNHAPKCEHGIATNRTCHQCLDNDRYA